MASAFGLSFLVNYYYQFITAGKNHIAALGCRDDLDRTPQPVFPLDLAALALLISSWIWIGWRIENPKPGRPSLSVLMADFRRDWMIQMVTRQPRIFDAQLISNLRQGTTFFASASMIAIGGGLALIGNTDPLAGVANDLTQSTVPAFVWEIKLLTALLFLSNAFLKHVWAHRLFGYCSVLMAAVPNDPKVELSYPRAAQAAELSITAAQLQPWHAVNLFRSGRSGLAGRLCTVDCSDPLDLGRAVPTRIHLTIAQHIAANSSRLGHFRHSKVTRRRDLHS